MAAKSARPSGLGGDGRSLFRALGRYSQATAECVHGSQIARVCGRPASGRAPYFEIGFDEARYRLYDL